MRALWVRGLQVQEQYALTSELLHHLVKVVRIQAGEDLLLLDGHGLQVWTKVTAVTKKEIMLGFQRKELAKRSTDLDLALGMPKREALELCLRQAVELGLGTVYLVRSAFSQMRPLEPDRLGKLLVSALEQSNASFLPQVKYVSWEQLAWEAYDAVTLLNSQSAPSSLAPSRTSGKRLLLVGPEGGFSSTELDFFFSQNNVTSLTLPTPILRTPTAVAVGAGLLLGTLLDREKCDKLLVSAKDQP